MRRLALMISILFASIAAAAIAEPIPMTPERWKIEGVAEFVERDGRQAVRLGPVGPPLKGGAATLLNSNFSTGTIEFDLMVGNRDFAGFAFRAAEPGNGELFYVRPHMNGNPDSTQYTPVVNGSPAWQIFSADGFESAVRFPIGAWMRVRADIYDRSALISIDGAPALAIPHLKSEQRSGLIELTAAGGAHFANVNVTPIENYRDPNPAPPPPPLPPGSVAAWHVSPAMAEDEAMTRAAARNWSGIEWRRIPVESNGIDNLSRAGPNAEGRNSYIARFTVRSPAAQTATMRFGFSDEVRVFLNGRPVFAGSDIQGSRDYRFLGIVGFWDTLFLPLEAGANEVAFVVSDGRNGGTAAAARFEANPDLTIE
jgi:hypothetical protein